MNSVGREIWLSSGTFESVKITQTKNLTGFKILLILATPFPDKPINIPISSNFLYPFQTGLKLSYFTAEGTALPAPLPAFFRNSEAYTQRIFVRVENAQNALCVSQTSFDLIVNPKPSLELQDTYNLCDLEPFLDLEVPGHYDSWEWKFEDGTIVSSTFSARLALEGTYRLEVSRTENGITCVNSSVFRLNRSVLPAIAEVRSRDWSSRNYIEIIAAGDGDLEYSIDGETYTDSNYFQQLSGGVYTVWVRDKNGCGTDSREVVLVDYPKFFTPNGDGYNDRWQLKGIAGLPETAIHIFDRYGKLLIQLSSNGPGWDGTLNGRPLPSDDYWFSVKLEGRVHKNHFSLVRQ